LVTRKEHANYRNFFHVLPRNNLEKFIFTSKRMQRNWNGIFGPNINDCLKCRIPNESHIRYSTSNPRGQTIASGIFLYGNWNQRADASKATVGLCL
jgi:hypothetical protein